MLWSLNFSTSAIADQEYSLNSDEGSPVDNFKIPVELDPAQLPGIVWKGEKTADILLYEFFDYNCGYCRRAALALDRLLVQDPGVRLGLVNNPILGRLRAGRKNPAGYITT